jgi:hypothetical protein
MNYVDITHYLEIDGGADDEILRLRRRAHMDMPPPSEDNGENIESFLNRFAPLDEVEPSLTEENEITREPTPLPADISPETNVIPIKPRKKKHKPTVKESTEKHRPAVKEPTGQHMSENVVPIESETVSSESESSESQSSESQSPRHEMVDELSSDEKEGGGKKKKLTPIVPVATLESPPIIPENQQAESFHMVQVECHSTENKDMVCDVKETSYPADLNELPTQATNAPPQATNAPTQATEADGSSEAFDKINQIVKKYREKKQHKK